MKPKELSNWYLVKLRAKNLLEKYGGDLEEVFLRKIPTWRAQQLTMEDAMVPDCAHVGAVKWWPETGGSGSKRPPVSQPGAFSCTTYSRPALAFTIRTSP